MKRIMLDLETMGNHSDAAIIAIGAVKFKDGKIVDEFYQTVSLDSCVRLGLTMDADTVMWWMGQSDEARGQFNEDGCYLSKALLSFSYWAGDGDKEMWGNGAAFDNVILANAYDKAGIKQPWAFYEDRCYRTIKSRYPEIKIERVGVYHNALDDAKSQALHLINIEKEFG